MAEELIIRVKIDGFSPQEQTGKGGQSSTSSAMLGAGAAMGLRGDKTKQQFIKDISPGGSQSQAWQKRSWDGDPDRVYAPELASIRKRGLVSTTWNVPGLVHRYGGPDVGMQTVDINIPFAQQGTGYLNQYSKQIKAAGAALAWKTADSIANVSRHKSGDSYANAQLNNSIKLAGYGAMIAMSGPAAPFVAAGIAVNEIANGIVEGINYRFDRALEGNQIRNMKIVAGDVSYGRRRGAL